MCSVQDTNVIRTRYTPECFHEVGSVVCDYMSHLVLNVVLQEDSFKAVRDLLESDAALHSTTAESSRPPLQCFWVHPQAGHT